MTSPAGEPTVFASSTVPRFTADPSACGG
jgi:hypothetical protein